MKDTDSLHVHALMFVGGKCLQISLVDIEVHESCFSPRE